MDGPFNLVTYLEVPDSQLTCSIFSLFLKTEAIHTAQRLIRFWAIATQHALVHQEFVFHDCIILNWELVLFVLWDFDFFISWRSLPSWWWVLPGDVLNLDSLVVRGRQLPFAWVRHIISCLFILDVTNLVGLLIGKRKVIGFILNHLHLLGFFWVLLELVSWILFDDALCFIIFGCCFCSLVI